MEGIALMILKTRALGDIGVVVRDWVNVLASSMNMIQPGTIYLSS